MPGPPAPPDGSPAIALVDLSGNIHFAQLQDVAAAIQTQLVRDLLPAWDVAATVTAYPTMGDVPFDSIPCTIVNGPLPSPNADSMGYHSTDAHGPFAKVVFSSIYWTVSASHEILELLVNPCKQNDFSTFRKIRLTLPDSDQTVVDALVEVCDPSESGDLSASSYTINGIAVANFIWPSWYNPDVSAEIDVFGDDADYTEREFIIVDVFAQATEIQAPAEDCTGLSDLPGGIYQQFELDPDACIDKTVELDITVQCTQFEIDVLDPDSNPCTNCQARVTGGPDDVDIILSDPIGNVLSTVGLKPGNYHVDVTCFTGGSCPGSTDPVDEFDVVVLDDDITTVTSTTDCLP